MTTSVPPFIVDALITAARDRAGLVNFGNEDFLEALTAYTVALNDKAGMLSERGAAMIFEELVGTLVNRLKTADYIRKYPEAEEKKISRPVFIVGLYRTATTKLQHLLCADPRWLYLQTWQTIYPIPTPGGKPGEEDPRIAAGQRNLEQLKQVAPYVFMAHPLEATDPSEEVPFLTQGFRQMEAKQINPAFTAWIESHDKTPMYLDLRRSLQVLQHQAQNGDQEERRYCLKAPSHLGNIETLMKVFPDAKIIFTHRDPLPAIHSFTMIRESLRRLYVDNMDPKVMGTEILEQAATALDNFVIARKRLPANTFLDLRFEDIVSRGLELTTDIYRHVDVPLTPEVRACLARADEKGEEQKNRAEGRDAAHYGLSRERVYERTRNYLAWAQENIGAVTRL